MTDIIEGNKLIAHFLQWHYISDAPNWMRNETGYSMTVTNFNYHNNWNDLMYVILKIKKLSLHKDLWEEQTHYYTQIRDAITELDIIKTWSTIVDFLVWYNKIKDLKHE